jgi:YesN/AraC family two-component response regulator
MLYHNNIKKGEGNNTQEHIHYHVMLIAKDRLLSTTDSVGEIAYNLGIEYPQYFSKLFKKTTGKIPAQFRNMN